MGADALGCDAPIPGTGGYEGAGAFIAALAAARVDGKTAIAPGGSGFTNGNGGPDNDPDEGMAPGIPEPE
jgi:hypothetical protein